MDLGIEFRGVKKKFGRKVALDHLTFVAKPGQITGLLGRNGAGKTTALRILSQLEHPNEGTATINGLPFSKHTPGSVGVSINLAFPPSRSVKAQLQIAALSTGASSLQMNQIAALTEIENLNTLKCSELSLGMRQRLSLACALIADPHTLILDEPVNGLDPDGIRWLHSFLRVEADRGRTILVSSHYLHDMEQYVDKVVIIQREILWQGEWPGDNTSSLAEIFDEVTNGNAIG
ncbi:CcmA ABC-type multidrug transport system, ATPase component [Candidatus Nanopelagicaceae bacterium]